MCRIGRNAVLQYASIPTEPKELNDFDQQLRACYALPYIVTEIALLGPSMAKQCCEYLWNYPLTAEGREFLYGTLENLW